MSGPGREHEYHEPAASHSNGPPQQSNAGDEPQWERTPDLAHSRPPAPDQDLSELSRRIIEDLAKPENNAGTEVIFVFRSYPPPPRLAEYVAEVGGEYYDLGDIFGEDNVLKTSGRNSRYWKATDITSGHWNHEGHREVGHYLARRLSERLAGRLD